MCVPAASHCRAAQCAPLPAWSTPSYKGSCFLVLQETLGTIMAQGFDPRVSNMHGALGAGAQAGSA